MVDQVKAGEPPRKPKPITRADIADLTTAFLNHLPASGLTEHDEPPRLLLRRDIIEQAMTKLLDNGDVIVLQADESQAVVELLSHAIPSFDHVDVDMLPVSYPASFCNALLSGFKRLAFANGRHFGLTNFDMGIEEDPQ